VEVWPLHCSGNGWFEWSGEPRHKQPWYIRIKTDRPMFMAAITSYRPGKEPTEDTGFAIVTGAAEGGMVDVHDRRPVVFSEEDALLWMDISLPPEQADDLARSMALPSEKFEWYPVSKDVNKAGNNGENLIQPVAT
jgi:putative SOS response-associated peptidase YedK